MKLDKNRVEALLHSKLATGFVFLLAKTIFKADPTLLVASGAVELAVAKHVEGVAQRKRTKLFLEDVATTAVEIILPVFVDDCNAGLEVEPVVAALTDALSASDLTLERLAALDFAPASIEATIAKSVPVDTGLSAGQDALLRRALRLSAEAVVDITRGFDGFQGIAVSEILARLTDIAADVRTSLDELRRAMVSASGQSSKAFSDYETHYRRQAERTLNHLEILGLESGAFRQRQPLSIAYVSLTISASRKGSRTATNHLSIGQLLASGARLVVLGPAGSGKTTLMQWLAVQAARDRLSEEVPTWGTKIPFLVRLRSYGGKDLPQIENLCDHVDLVSASLRPSAWIRSKFDSGEALLLLDGLDEVSGPEKASVYAWVDQLLSVYPDLPVVITARNEEVDQDWALRNGFTTAEVNELSLPQVRVFIDRWFEAKSASEADIPVEAGRLASELFGVILGSRDLRALATRPLFCAMICALYSFRQRYVPQNKIDLYEACLSLLLDRRDRDRRVSANQVDLDLREKVTVISGLALEMLERTRAELDKESAVDELDRMLASTGVWSSRLTGNHILSFFVKRSGLLRESSSGAVEFTHRSFQEFLAAKRSVKLGKCEDLLPITIRNPGCQVVPLAAGLASRPIANGLIRSLLDASLKVPQGRETLVLLAVAAFELTDEPEEAVSAKVKSAVSRIVPPASFEAARAMAAAGEIAAEYLENRDYPPHVAVKCIYALGKIGGFVAFRKLVQYAKIPDEIVAAKLVEQWPMFPGPGYAKEVLSFCPRLRTIEISGRVDGVYAGLDQLPDLVSLRVADLDDFQVLVRLGDLRRLQVFHIEGTPALALPDLASLMPNLRELRVDSAQCLGRIKIGAELPNLEHLSVSGCPTLQSIDLSECPSSITVSIWDCPSLNLEAATMGPAKRILADPALFGRLPQSVRAIASKTDSR